MGISKEILTEEKVRKLKPLFERALANKYGKEFKLLDLTVGHITVDFKKDSKKFIIQSAVDRADDGQ